MVTQETIFYRLVVRNHNFDALKNIFGGKMGMAATVAPKGLGLQDPIIKLAQYVDLLGQPLSRKHVFKIVCPEPPPPLKATCKNPHISSIAGVINF